MRAKKQIMVILLFSMLLPLGASGQTFQDLVLMSQYDQTTTARSMGLGQAVGAVGGDIATLSINPAGLGLFRNFHLGISSSLYMQMGKMNFLEEQHRARAVAVGFDGFGATFPIRFSESKAVKNLTFGISYSKLQSYRRNFTLSGLSRDENTFLDGLTYFGNVNRIEPIDLVEDTDASYYPYDNQDWYLVSAYNSYLVQRKIEGGYFVDFKAPWSDGEFVRQNQRVRGTGYLDEWDFSLALNVSHKLYIGATVGVQVLDRKWTKITREETDDAAKTGGLQYGEFIESNRETGSGANFKFGLVYRPLDLFRLGVAIHTPTFMKVKSTFTLDSKAVFINPDPAYDEPEIPVVESKSPEGKFSYEFFSPLRFTGSAAVFFGKMGLLSADYEMVYMPQMAFEDDVAYLVENEFMTSGLKPMHEVRLGTEWFLGSLALRAGASYRTSPYKDKTLALYGDRWLFSGGLGYYWSFLSFDLSYRHTIQKGNGYMYAYEGYSRSFDRTDSQALLLFTLGFTF